MRTDQGFDNHWLNIEPERMARYEEMFKWNPASEMFYEPARIGTGQVIGDFGCGPGYASIEFARRVGPDGQVHAFDINPDFIASARDKAKAAGLSDRITVHQLDGPDLPLGPRSLDRIVARNTLIYVEDPTHTLGEFRRCLRPGGIAHAIEGDWHLTAVEPVATKDWRQLIEAASWAWPRPEMGRQLYGHARKAGFDDVTVRVMTSPDTTGRLNGMIETVASYARQGGLSDERLEAIGQTIARAQADGRYLAIAPQFVVTATVVG